MASEYGVRMWRLLRGTVEDWRYFAVLVRGLPDDSRTVTVQIDRARDEKNRPKPDGPAPTPRWAQTNWQLHALREEVRHLQYTVVAVASSMAGGKKASAPPKPLPTPVDPRRPHVSAADKAAAWRAMTAQLRIAEPSDGG